MKQFAILLSSALFWLTMPAFAEDTSDLTPVRWVRLGVYGGNQSSVTVDTRSMRLDLPCAVGKVPARPVLTEDNTFRATGTYASRLVANPLKEYPAVFTGRVSGQTMWIEVDVQGRDERRHFSFGPLYLGKSSQFFRCL